MGYPSAGSGSKKVRALGANVAYTNKIAVIAQVERDDFVANREMVGDLRETLRESSMKREVGFLFDFGSAFSYPARAVTALRTAEQRD